MGSGETVYWDRFTGRTPRGSARLGSRGTPKMRILAAFLFVAAAFAADDPWTKVKELKSGTEVRVMKKGAAQPVIGKFDEATDENLILVVKTEQTAIAKDAIDRIDYRPAKPRLVKETKTTVE